MKSIDLKKKQAKTLIPEYHPRIVNNKANKAWLKFRIAWTWFWIARKNAGSAKKGWQQLKGLRDKYQAVFGGELLNKYAKVGNRYFWRLGAPGFPSLASKKLYDVEFKKYNKRSDAGLRTMFLAITNKCPLNCEHCFEWDNLNQGEKLSRQDLIDIVHKYQDYPTAQILFSGGEPMLRFKDLLYLLENARPGTDFWVITSGLGVTEEKARQLKAAGLTGFMISLDHHQAEAHNQFRGFDQAFQSAMNAVKSAQKYNLAITLALCVRKDFVNEKNLTAYMELAKKLGVTFVQFIEPRAKGRYKDTAEALTAEQVELLERMYLNYNQSEVYRDYPIINYIGYHQRRVGCFGAGDRFLYIDTAGKAHVCPFCEEAVCSTLEFSPGDTVRLLSQHPCHTFEKSTL